MKDTIDWNDELVHAGTGGGSNRHRGSLTLQAPDGAMIAFAGASIPGLCRVLNEKYNKNGKWSFSAWTLKLAPDVKAWTGKGGTLRDLSEQSDVRIRYHGVNAWSEVPEEIRPVFRVVLQKTSARLDENGKPV